MVYKLMNFYYCLEFAGFFHQKKKKWHIKELREIELLKVTELKNGWC